MSAADEEKHFEIWKPIGQGWLYVCEVQNHHMRFKAYESLGTPRTLDGVALAPEFARAGATSGEDTTTDYREAKVAIAGHIAWDGDSETTIADDNRCGQRDLRERHAAELAVFDIAAEHMPNFNKEVADYEPPAAAAAKETA